VRFTTVISALIKLQFFLRSTRRFTGRLLTLKEKRREEKRREEKRREGEEKIREEKRRQR
jgi:hypothetical protein